MLIKSRYKYRVRMLLQYEERVPRSRITMISTCPEDRLPLKQGTAICSVEEAEVGRGIVHTRRLVFASDPDLVGKWGNVLEQAEDTTSA